ncbi:flagellar basal body P-ring formation chaperone FlgA [Fontivita pretiosa]|uniref:flagellar basal body P-ring formation chaperone FlgA n=1 Tax=Fontivita pretiosa TaxID=2989684 RepID=UPI003D18198A
MMYPNGRPLGRKQTVRLVVCLTILAWATQTLLKQWGYGAEVDVAATDPVESFVAPAAGSGLPIGGGTLEIRSEATVVGPEVRLKQICRWSEQQQAFFEPMGELVLARLGPEVPFKTISVREIQGILRDAGVNLAAINFAGATSCTVARADVEYDQTEALRQWIHAREAAAATQPQADDQTPVAARAERDQPGPSSASSSQEPVQTLRESLIADLARRLNLSPESLQVDFKPQDEKLLAISKPLFRFEIEPLRARSLGNVAWNVTIPADGGEPPRTVTVTAQARAWQKQLVVAKPIAARQVIRAEDLVERRALVDQIEPEAPLCADQVVGQQAARELKPGTVLTARMIDPVELAKPGQLITVSLDQGTVRIKTVARAMEGGSYGQTIRVKNETTREVFQVVLTGPQTATMNLASPIASAGDRN